MADVSKPVEACVEPAQEPWKDVESVWLPTVGGPAKFYWEHEVDKARSLSETTIQQLREELKAATVELDAQAREIDRLTQEPFRITQEKAGVLEWLRLAEKREKEAEATVTALRAENEELRRRAQECILRDLPAAQAEVTRLTQARDAQTWQPIETAPKDGTKVLLCQAFNVDGGPIGKSAWGIFVQVAAWWGAENGGSGAWIVYCSMVRDPDLHFKPTHWMPLPPSPTAGEPT